MPQLGSIASAVTRPDSCVAGPVPVAGSKNCEASPATFGVTGPSARHAPGSRPAAAEKALVVENADGPSVRRLRLEGVARLDREVVVDVGARIRAVGDLLGDRVVGPVAVGFLAARALELGFLVRVEPHREACPLLMFARDQQCAGRHGYRNREHEQPAVDS